MKIQLENARQYFQRSQEELTNNPRMRLALIVIVLLLLFNVHKHLDDWRQQRKAVTESVAAKLEDLQRVAGEREWPARAKQARAQLEQESARLWRASSEGLAQAQLRDWLEKQARTNGVPIQRITVEVGRALSSVRYTPVRAELQGDYSAGAWQMLVAALESATPDVVIEFENISFRNPRKPQYRLSVTAWFEFSPTEPTR